MVKHRHHMNDARIADIMYYCNIMSNTQALVYMYNRLKMTTK